MTTSPSSRHFNVVQQLVVVVFLVAVAVAVKATGVLAFSQYQCGARQLQRPEHRSSCGYTAKSPPVTQVRLVDEQSQQSETCREEGEWLVELAPPEGADLETQKNLIDLYGDVFKAYVSALMGKEEEIPNTHCEGMSVLRDVPVLERQRWTQNVVVRNITKPLWSAVIDLCNSGDYRVAVIGTPGTGKSTTTAVLIRMLLMQGRKVVYRLLNADAIYEMTPSVEEKEVSLTFYDEPQQESKLHRAIPSLRDPEVFYVVDPGQTQRNCNPNTFVEAKVIIVTSPNPVNWGGPSLTKKWGPFGGDLRYHPLWTLEEILNAKAFIEPELGLTEDDLKERFRHVGGVPRHIFCNAKTYELFLELQRKAIGELTETAASAIATEGVLNGDTREPKSAVIGYEVERIDREGSRPYGRFKMVIISSVARESIVADYMTRLWNEMVGRGEGGRWMLEAYVRNLMIQDSQKFKFRPCLGKNNTGYNETQYVELGGCDSIELVVDIVDAAQKKTKTVFHSTNPNYPLIDFMYQDSDGIFYAFQMTTGASHSADPKRITDFVEKFGNTTTQVYLYYAVPSNRFPKFVSVPTNPVAALGEDAKKGIEIRHLYIADPNQEETSFTME